jgi:hypothetical protein
MDLSSYLLQGFNILPKITVSINGTDVEAVFNQSTHRDNKTLGGYEPDNEATIVVATKNLSSPRALKGKIVVMDSLQWRVIKVRYGVTVTHLDLISVDKL